MNFFEAVILGLVQGLSEFLPISSSGHLALLQQFFDIDSENVVAFTVLLHLGTLMSVFIMYRKDIWALILELIATLKDVFTGKGLRINANPTRRLGFMIIVATIPTGIIGILFNDLFESMYTSVLPIGAGLIFTGFILMFAEKTGTGSKDVGEMKFRNALFVGLMQGIAICPGVSRSGSTLVGGLCSGLNREFAVRFAFIISIPSILGSAVIEIPEVIEKGMDMATALPVLAGIIVSAVSGLFAIKAMIKLVTGKKLYIFSIYTWIVGSGVILYSLMSM